MQTKELLSASAKSLAPHRAHSAHLVCACVHCCPLIPTWNTFLRIAWLLAPKVVCEGAFAAPGVSVAPLSLPTACPGKGCCCVPCRCPSSLHSWGVGSSGFLPSMALSPPSIPVLLLSACAAPTAPPALRDSRAPSVIEHRSSMPCSCRPPADASQQLLRFGDWSPAPRLPNPMCCCAPPSSHPVAQAPVVSGCWCLPRFKRRFSHIRNCAFPHVTSARHWSVLLTVTRRVTSAPHFVHDQARLH